MVYTHKHAETYYQSAALHTRPLFSYQRQLCYIKFYRSFIQRPTLRPNKRTSALRH